ncbi:MAG: OmpA family protein [Treponemataceae bacterium]
MKNKLFIVFFFVLFSSFAEEFSFLYNHGENYFINIQTEEKAYIEGEFQYKANINTEVITEVLSVYENGADHSVEFRVSKEILPKNNEGIKKAEATEKVRFTKDSFGNHSIDKKYFNPVVRNNPIFPKKNIKIGESWSASGFESYDFRAFGLEKPCLVTTKTIYKYVGVAIINGKKLHEISAKTTINGKVKSKQKKLPADYPKKVTGTVDTTLFWNTETGLFDSYDEIFVVRITTLDRFEHDFVGSSKAIVLNKKKHIPSAKPKTKPTTVSNDVKTLSLENEKDVKNQINQLALDNISVTVNGDGLVIRLENVQFQSNSSNLMANEKEKIKKIADVLKNYSNDLLVSGHTALAGTPAARMELSTLRAQSVANYLVEQNVRKKNAIIVKGFGAEKPIADNKSVEGMAKNRRVEITILK